MQLEERIEMEPIMYKAESCGTSTQVKLKNQSNYNKRIFVIKRTSLVVLQKRK